MESVYRSFLKAFSWRLTATLVTMVTVFALTGRMDFALGVGGLDALAKLLLFVVHEQAWARVDLGRNPVGIRAVPEPVAENPLTKTRRNDFPA